jgi:CRP-like cAMP-binding protein
VALEAVETRALQRGDFDALRAKSPHVDHLMIQVLAERVRQLTEHLMEALYVPVEKRVLRRLLALAESYGGAAATAGDAVVLPVTQDALASMAGTTRPTANRVLKAAEQQGTIALQRARIEVIDLAALEKAAR